jgi:uncharacterized damage-inducible protein DinB
MSVAMSGTDLGNREFLIRRWEQESAGFEQVLRALLADQLDYRPHPRSRSAREIAALLVSLQQSCIDLCTSQRSSYNTSMRWHPVDRHATLEEMIEAYKVQHNTLAEKLRNLDDVTWNHQAWMIVGDQEILLKDTVGGLLWLGLFDAVHHRGQLTTYIRPMGGKVPGLYGPSADDGGMPR